MSAFLIIDGYNLMHAAGLARANYGPGDLARQRIALLFQITHRLTGEERKRCTVVFDAIDAPQNLPDRFRHHQILIQFAAPGQEADEVIENLIARHSAPRSVTIVSGDHRLQAAIRKRRGTAIDSEQFLKQRKILAKSPSQPGNNSSTVELRGSDDLEFWLQEFGDVRPEAIREQVSAETPESKNDWDSVVEDLQKQLQDPDAIDRWLREPEDGRRPPDKR